MLAQTNGTATYSDPHNSEKKEHAWSRYTEFVSSSHKLGFGLSRERTRCPSMSIVSSVYIGLDIRGLTLSTVTYSAADDSVAKRYPEFFCKRQEYIITAGSRSVGNISNIRPSQIFQQFSKDWDITSLRGVRIQLKLRMS